MSQAQLLKYRHYQAEIILLCLGWYLSYSLSYRGFEEMMAERGLNVDYKAIDRWVQHYGSATMHQSLKRNAGQGSSQPTIPGELMRPNDAMHQLRKGQVQGTPLGQTSGVRYGSSTTHLG